MTLDYLVLSQRMALLVLPLATIRLTIIQVVLRAQWVVLKIFLIRFRQLIWFITFVPRALLEDLTVWKIAYLTYWKQVKNFLLNGLIPFLQDMILTICTSITFILDDETGEILNGDCRSVD